MDFGTFPPEITSTWLYTGPGSAPMLAAASAWSQLAAEHRSAATGYQSIITELANEGWMGPASTAMARAAAPYVLWMSTVAAQLEQTAAQTKAAAAAYEAAHTTIVSPWVVAANRTELAALLASNVLGQNAPAIAANQANYGAMWANNTGTMYAYAANSAAATKLPPFAAPMQSTNPAGQSNQAAAVAQANGSAGTSGVQSTLSQAMSTTPNSLQAMASPVQSTPTTPVTPPASTPTPLSPGDLTNTASNLASSSFSPLGVAGITQTAADIAVLRGAAIAAGDPLGLGAIDPFTPLMPGMGLGAAGLGMHGFGAAGLSGVGAASAAMGQATSVGALSVPASWATAVPAAASPAASASLVSSWAAAPVAEAGGMPGMPGMPMAGAGAGRGYGFAAPRYGFKPTVMGRPVIAG